MLLVTSIGSRSFLRPKLAGGKWSTYQNNPNFTLTVVITRDNPEGGNTGNYEWNDDGKISGGDHYPGLPA